MKMFVAAFLTNIALLIKEPHPRFQTFHRKMIFYLEAPRVDDAQRLRGEMKNSVFLVATCFGNKRTLFSLNINFCK